MPAPIRKKMRRWNDESGSRSKRAPALTVRDMVIPPEKMRASIRAGGSSWQAARRRIARSAWAGAKVVPALPLHAMNVHAMNGRYAKWEASIGSFDERAFRDALSVFPTGVAVVTAFSDAGERLGLTVSSFNSVSLSPPLVLFSVSRAAYGFAAWQRVDRYAVNILNEDQEIMSNRFARALGEKWEGVSVLPGETGVPVLPNVLVSLECVTHARHDGGDHEIFVGRVVAISVLHAAMPRPLVFFRGRYGKLR